MTAVLVILGSLLGVVGIVLWFKGDKYRAHYLMTIAGLILTISSLLSGNTTLMVGNLVAAGINLAATLVSRKK